MMGGALGDSKQESDRRALHPTLFAELYPEG